MTQVPPPNRSDARLSGGHEQSYGPRLDVLAKLAAPLHIGGVCLANRVALAPMSGVSDAPFRDRAAAAGAGMVVCEMTACSALTATDARSVAERTRRLTRTPGRPLIVQLAGREAQWMARGAQIATDLGADIIDINMGCPARMVTKGLSGSALMRDLDHAQRLIAATVAHTERPVSLKMRLGWDRASINAAELARRAQACGVKLLTVHGRTRQQFYEGTADWAAIAEVVAAVSIPVIINGDIASPRDARRALSLSGAAGVMVGRASYGQPWCAGEIAAHACHAANATPAATDVKPLCAQANGVGADGAAPAICASRAIPTTSAERAAFVQAHYEAMLAHYGTEKGRRHARKHLAWYAEQSFTRETAVAHWRAQLCAAQTPHEVLNLIDAMYHSDDCISAVCPPEPGDDARASDHCPVRDVPAAA